VRRCSWQGENLGARKTSQSLLVLSAPGLSHYGSAIHLFFADIFDRQEEWD